MKSNNQIKMDFQKARAEADRLDCIADQLKILANSKIEQSMINLSSAWTGINSKLFLQKESLLQNNIRETAKTLYNVALDIRKTAQRVYIAEMQAYEIAARRDKEDGG